MPGSGPFGIAFSAENHDVNTPQSDRIRYQSPASVLSFCWHWPKDTIGRFTVISYPAFAKHWEFSIYEAKKNACLLVFSPLISHHNEKVHHCHHFCRDRRSRRIWAWSNIAGIPRESSSGQYRSKETKAYPHRRVSRNRYVCVHAHSRA